MRSETESRLSLSDLKYDCVGCRDVATQLHVEVVKYRNAVSAGTFVQMCPVIMRTCKCLQSAAELGQEIIRAELWIIKHKGRSPSENTVLMNKLREFEALLDSPDMTTYDKNAPFIFNFYAARARYYLMTIRNHAERHLAGYHA